MKIYNKWLSLLLVLIMAMSLLPYAVSAEGTWTESDLSPTMLTTSNPNWIRPSSTGHSADVAVFEWWFDLPSEVRSDLIPNISSYPAGVAFYGLRDAAGRTFDVITSNVGFTNRNAFDRDVATQYGKVATNGGQRIHGLEIVNISDKTRRVWINGAEWIDCGKSSFNADTAIGFSGVSEGTVAFVSPTDYPVADFDASGYAAQLTSSDITKAVIGGSKLSGTSTDLALNHTLTVKSKMTVGELIGLLEASDGASIEVLNASGEVTEESDTLGENFAVQVTSENEKVVVKYNGILDLKWPNIPYSFENTDTDGAKQLAVYTTGQVTPDNPFLNPEKAYIFHYTYTPTETSTSDATNLSNSNTTYAYGAGVTLSVNDGADGWTPVVFTEGFEHQRNQNLLLSADKGIYENAPIGRGAAGDGAIPIGQERIGETYHVTAIVKQDSSDNLIYSKIFINGAELVGGRVYSNFFNKTAGNGLLFVGKGIKGTLTEVDLDVYDNFQEYYESYQAQVISHSDNVIVSADETSDGKPFQNFSIELIDITDMTVGELLESLEWPENATAKVKFGGNEADENEFVQSPMELEVTSANGEVTLNYTIIAPISQIRSETYRVNNSEKTISEILRYTPTEEVINAISLVGAQEIVGVVSADGSPAGGCIDEGMRLELIDDMGDPLFYELELNTAWTEFKSFDGDTQIKELKGKINGKTTLISGKIDIPADGLSENQGLYFELDNGNPDYVIEFTKDGAVNVWGNEVGKWAKGASYDYAIVTNPQAGTCEAYFNGIKLLDGESIEGSYDGVSDPFELVGGSYNPCSYGGFLLTEIYSEEAFEDVYVKSSTELTASGVNAGVVMYDMDVFEIAVFADESYTVGDIAAALSCTEGASINYFSLEDQEITDNETLISEVAYLTVTSADERFVVRYNITISQDVLRSNDFIVSNTEKTVGKFLKFTPVSVLLDSIAVRPDWKPLGVYRDGKNTTTDDLIMAGDVLRLEKNGELLDYTLQLEEDFGNSGQDIMIPGGTEGKVTVMEGKFTVPDNGNHGYQYQMFVEESGNLIYFFRIGHVSEEFKDKFRIWEEVLCTLEAGKTYEWAIVNRHDQKNADIYLNGVLVRQNISMGNVQPFVKVQRIGALIQNDQSFRFYQVYSADTYRYENNLTLKSSVNSITYNPHLITVTSSDIVSVGDLLESLTFPSENVKKSAKVYGNGSEITDLEEKLVTGMTLNLTADGGKEDSYRINVAASPITSYVFDVSGTNISYNKNLSYYDFIRYCILADGCTLKVTTAGGAEVTGGNMANGMKAVVGDKTYTIHLPATAELPVVAITDAEADEIALTADAFEKTITATGENITRVAVYFDGEATVLASTAGTYTFSKEGLTIGRHEIYAEVVSDSGRSESARYNVFAFDKETDRLRAARRPVVMNINYLDQKGNVIPASDKVSYTDTKQIELVFNKALTESTVNKDNIRIYCGDTAVSDYEVKYVTGDGAYYAVIITLGSQLDPSAEYKIVTGKDIMDITENSAGDDSVICFTTFPEPFDICSQRIVDVNGKDITSLGGGDSAALDVTFTNTTGEEKKGDIILVIFDGNKMVGYSITPFTLQAGTVVETLRTKTASIEPGASEELTIYRYIWNSVAEMDTLLK